MQPRELDPEDPRVQEAVFGKEVENFLHSPIGDYLLSKARNEAETATEQLKTVEPTLTDKIRELQSTIRRAESIMGWLGDAVANGHRAISLIDGEEEDVHG